MPPPSARRANSSTPRRPQNLERQSSGSTDGIDHFRDRSPSVASSIPAADPESPALHSSSAKECAPFLFPQHRRLVVGNLVMSVILELDKANLPAVRELAERLQSDPLKSASLQFVIEEILRRRFRKPNGIFQHEEDGYRLKYDRTAWPEREKFLYSRDGHRLEWGDRVTFTLMTLPASPHEEIYDYTLPSPAEQDADGFHMDVNEEFHEPLASSSNVMDLDSGDDLRPGSAMRKRARMLRANLPRPARQIPTSRLFSTPTPASDPARFPERGNSPLLMPDTPSRSDSPPPLPPASSSSAPPLPPSSSTAPPPAQSTPKRPRNPDLTITLPTQVTSQSPAKRARTSASPATSNAGANSASSSSKELSADDRETILEAFRQIASNSPARGPPGSPASAHSVLDAGTPRNITIHRTIVVRQSLMSAILTPIKNALFGAPSNG
ncbi:hypothetical protein HDU88_003578 [Geranomyces variabilis]|nr:hypothetical protein HDU88_003578 [Geranomyces variabilis]